MSLDSCISPFREALTPSIKTIIPRGQQQPSMMGDSLHKLLSPVTDSGWPPLHLFGEVLRVSERLTSLGYDPQFAMSKIFHFFLRIDYWLIFP